MAKKSHSGALLAVAAIVFVGLLMTGNLKLPAASVSTSDNSLNIGSNTGSTTPSGLNAGDQLTVTLNHRDALTEASLTEATNVKTTLITPKSGGGFTVVTTGSGQTYTIGSDGKIWLSFETQASGQSYVWAKDRTINANPGLFNAGDAVYTDIEGDGTKEWVISVSTSGLESQKALSGTKPDRTLNIKWFNENTMTLSSPSDVSSIGTTAGTAKYTQYTLTGTAGDMTAVTRIQYKLNSTSDSKWDPSQMYVKFVDTNEVLPLTSFTKSQDGTNTTYELLYGYTLDKARYVEFPQNGSGTIKVEIKNVWNLSSGNVITTTLYVDSVNEVDGSNTQLSDAVNNSA